MIRLPLPRAAGAELLLLDERTAGVFPETIPKILGFLRELQQKGKTRYPVTWPTHHTKEEAQKAKDFAEMVGKTIKKSLSQ
jgi:energy-coupling factor transporter ATP-binding protein EcfA2